MTWTIPCDEDTLENLRCGVGICACRAPFLFRTGIGVSQRTASPWRVGGSVGWLLYRPGCRAGIRLDQSRRIGRRSRERGDGGRRSSSLLDHHGRWTRRFPVRGCTGVRRLFLGRRRQKRGLALGHRDCHQLAEFDSPRHHDPFRRTAFLRCGSHSHRPRRPRRIRRWNLHAAHNPRTGGVSRLVHGLRRRLWLLGLVPVGNRTGLATRRLPRSIFLVDHLSR